MEHDDADDENEKDEVDEEDEEEDDLIQMKIRPAVGRRYSASAVGIPRLAKNDDGSARSNGRPMLRRTSTTNSVTMPGHRGASQGRRSASSEKEPVSIAYIAPTILKPGVSGKGSMDDDEDEDDDDEIFARMGVDGYEEGGVDPNVTMYADGPYSYVYGAGYSPGPGGLRYTRSSEKDLQQYFAPALGNSQATTYHGHPDEDRLLSPPIVGSPRPISYNESSEISSVPVEHSFEERKYKNLNAVNKPYQYRMCI